MEPEKSNYHAPIYLGKTIRAFVSYSNVDKRIAANLKNCLDNLGIEVFLAHEDIRPSEDWQNEILRALKLCDVFLPLLTDNFHTSHWTNQESGMAYLAEKFIIPLKINRDPEGFISKFQALTVNPAEAAAACERVFFIIASEKEYTEAAKDCLIRSFVNSKTWKDANYKSKLLKKVEPFSVLQLNEIVRAYLANNQVSEGYASRAFVVEDIYKKNTEIILPFVKVALEQSLYGENVQAESEH
jgi:hypothetical protein